MGSKLGVDEYRASMNGLKKLYFTLGKKSSSFNLNVEVLNNTTDEIEFELCVPTTVSYDNMTQQISLIWEEAGLKNYKAWLLLGFV